MIKRVSYIKDDPSPFEQSPALQTIWSDKRLQNHAEKSIQRYNLHHSGEIFIIKTTNNETVGITGYYLLTDQHKCGLRWHDIVPDHRHKGYSLGALNRVIRHIVNKHDEITQIQEFAPVNQEKIISHFKNYGFEIENNSPKIRPQVPDIETIKMI